MVREIMRDEAFLAQKAELATLEDLPVAQDLLDTLTAHKAGCVGMAANMIGVCKRIIILSDTHGLLWPEVLKYLSQTDTIIHGGDINTQAIVNKLREYVSLYCPGEQRQGVGGGTAPQSHLYD